VLNQKLKGGWYDDEIPGLHRGISGGLFAESEGRKFPKLAHDILGGDVGRVRGLAGEEDRRPRRTGRSPQVSVYLPRCDQKALARRRGWYDFKPQAFWPGSPGEFHYLIENHTHNKMRGKEEGL